MIVVLSLVPCLLFGMWNIGYQHHQALGITNVSLMDNFIFGAISTLNYSFLRSRIDDGVHFAIIRKHTINEGF
jgi:Na+-transporting NADH:ubiquinone oxidoreductase subunit B